MGADYNDIIARLQMQLATPPQQQFLGLSAPPDLTGLKGVLAKMQQQAFLAQQGNTPGQFGYLHDAGTKAFTSAGQQLGNDIGNATAPPPAPNPQTVPIQQAIAQAKSAYNALIAQDVPEDQAQIQAAKMLVQAGVPGAEQALAAAYTGSLKNADNIASAQKNTSQGKAADDEVRHRSAEEERQLKQNTWTDTGRGNQFYTEQVNGLGEKRRVGENPTAPAANVKPVTADDIENTNNLAKKVGNYELSIGDVLSRAKVDDRKAFLNKVYEQNPDFDVKNFKQSQDALKAYGPSGAMGQQVLKTQNAMNHLSALQEYNDAIKNGASPQIAQMALNRLNVALGMPEGSTVQAVAPIVASEVASSLVKGGGGVAEREEKAKELNAQLNLSPAQAAANINAMRSLLGAQYKNHKSLYEKTTLRKDFEDKFPVDGGFPPPPGTKPAESPGSDGWTVVNGVKIRVKQGQ